MTGQALTTLEAKTILEEYIEIVWPGEPVDIPTLARVLAGASLHGVCDARVDGIDEETARRALDRFDDINGRPPTPVELSVAFDRLLCPDAIAARIANTRLILRNSIERRAHDHQQLRAESETRRTPRSA